MQSSTPRPTTPWWISSFQQTGAPLSPTYLQILGIRLANTRLGNFLAGKPEQAPCHPSRVCTCCGRTPNPPHSLTPFRHLPWVQRRQWSSMTCATARTDRPSASSKQLLIMDMDYTHALVSSRSVRNEMKSGSTPLTPHNHYL